MTICMKCIRKQLCKAELALCGNLHVPFFIIFYSTFRHTIVLCRKNTQITRSKHHQHPDTMPHAAALRIGGGARCSILLMKWHPSKEVAEKFPDKLPHQRVHDLTATRYDTVTHCGQRMPQSFLRVPPFLGLRCRVRQALLLLLYKKVILMLSRIHLCQPHLHLQMLLPR